MFQLFYLLGFGDSAGLQLCPFNLEVSQLFFDAFQLVVQFFLLGFQCFNAAEVSFGCSFGYIVSLYGCIVFALFQLYVACQLAFCQFVRLCSVQFFDGGCQSFSFFFVGFGCFVHSIFGIFYCGYPFFQMGLLCLCQRVLCQSQVLQGLFIQSLLFGQFGLYFHQVQFQLCGGQLSLTFAFLLLSLQLADQRFQTGSFFLVFDVSQFCLILGFQRFGFLFSSQCLVIACLCGYYSFLCFLQGGISQDRGGVGLFYAGSGPQQFRFRLTQDGDTFRFIVVNTPGKHRCRAKQHAGYG